VNCETRECDLGHLESVQPTKDRLPQGCNPGCPLLLHFRTQSRSLSTSSLRSRRAIHLAAIERPWMKKSESLVGCTGFMSGVLAISLIRIVSLCFYLYFFS